MSETAPRGIANLATRRVDPKRMLARNRQAEETPVDEPADVEASSATEASTATEAVALPAPAPASAPSQPKTPRRSSAPPVDEDEAGYLDLERKEARLREGQLGELTSHARRLNKAKTGRAPRITENTLIRVAIDLLLSRVDELQGNTEAELRKSVGL